MPTVPPSLIQPWHDFYSLVGTASATLVGLMFVAASIGAQIFKEDNRAAIATFISPTVVHFSTVLFICILSTIPDQSGTELIVVLAVVGLLGSGYSLQLWFQVLVRRQFKVDFLDRILYALVPGIGHLLILFSAITLMKQPATGLYCLAAALITLMIAAIRNAWDMTTWIVMRTPIQSDHET
jgi:hypothetical protein